MRDRAHVTWIGRAVVRESREAGSLVTFEGGERDSAFLWLVT